MPRALGVPQRARIYGPSLGPAFDAPTGPALRGALGIPPRLLQARHAQRCGGAWSGGLETRPGTPALIPDAENLQVSIWFLHFQASFKLVSNSSFKLASIFSGCAIGNPSDLQSDQKK